MHKTILHRRRRWTLTLIPRMKHKIATTSPRYEYICDIQRLVALRYPKPRISYRFLDCTYIWSIISGGVSCAYYIFNLPALRYTLANGESEHSICISRLFCIFASLPLARWTNNVDLSLCLQNLYSNLPFRFAPKCCFILDIFNSISSTN